MNMIKRVILIMVITLVIVLGIMPSFSYGESLNDAQRKALVDVVVKIIDEGNKSRVLRYSQGHRMYGYDWRKVTQSTKQLTTGYVNLTDADLVKVKEILVRDLGQDWEDVEMPKIKAYYCNFLGDDINDTIPFDCSSLVSAAYNMTVGTPYGNWAWNSSKYSESSDWFEVSSGMSSLKQGDILWKKGHVAIYLGDCYGNGKNYVAEARGFARISKSSEVMRQKLLEFLNSNPKYIADHPNYNKKMPTLQLPESGIMDVTKQVVIVEYNPNRFDKVASYIGPINPGRAIDVTNLTTTNPGNGSGAGDGSDGGNSSTDTSGLDHDPIVLPGDNTVVWPKDMVLEDQILATSEGYFYKGTPTYGQYVGKISLFNWLIEGTENVLDWIIGFVTYAVKAVLIGWTAIVENVMSNILNFGVEPATGSTAVINENVVLTKISSGAMLAYTVEDATSKLEVTPVATLADNENNSSNTTNTRPAVSQNSDIDASETKKKITIEDVLFNRVPVLDINFFDFENAGGQKLSEGSLLYKLRETIASWYYVIRMAVIMGMLVTLLYAAIKMVISLPNERAEYKSKLIDWLVGFIIVFSIHYFMVAIITFNNQIVKLLDPVISSSTTVDTPKIESGSNSNITTQNDGQTSLYEAIRIQAYDIRATTGLVAAVMYMVLVVFTIRFVILYAKRMFILAVLTVISPIMGLLYSINKKKYKIGDWGKEYVYNVLIQFIHVVIYTAIVGLAFDISKLSTFKGGIIALMTLAFLIGSEALVKKMFGFDKAASSGSLLDSTVGQLAVFKATQSLINKAEKKIENDPNDRKSNGNWLTNLHTRKIQSKMSVSDWEKQYEAPEGVGETDEEMRERRAKKILASESVKPNTRKVNPLFAGDTDYIVDKDGVPITPYYEEDPNKKNYFTMSTVNNRLDDLREEEKGARIAYMAQGLKDVYHTFAGSVSVMAAVPMLVVSPKYGLGLGAYGIHSLASSMGRRKIAGAKSGGEKRKWTGKRLIFAWATGGASEGIANMKMNYDDANYVLQTSFVKRKELLEQARDVEDKLAREIVELELLRKKDSNNQDEGIETERVKEAKEKMDEVARNIDKAEFEKAVNLTLMEVKKKDIEKIVENYILNKKDGKLTNKDIEKIAKQLGQTVEKKYKDISLNNEFSEVIRDEIRDRIVTANNYIVEASDTAASIREKYNRNDNKAENTEEKVSMFGKDMTKHVDSNEKASENEHTENTKVHLKDDDKEKLSNKKVLTEEELEGKVDEVIKNMKSEELIDIIDSALKRKESINRKITNPKYEKLMDRVRELNRINSEYKELTGEEMYQLYEIKDKKVEKKRDKKGELQYQSVSDLVKNMRNYLVDYINIKA